MKQTNSSRREYPSFHRLGIMLVLCGFILFSPTATWSGEGLLEYRGDFYFTNSSKGTMWTSNRSQILSSKNEVQQHLSKLNRGEFHDWRLPTKEELHSLLAIFDMKQNGDVKLPIEGYYWLAGDNGQQMAGAWEVGDGCGPERHFYQGEKGHVWATRP